MTNKEKLSLLPVMIEPMKKQLEKAVICLKQSQEDWCVLNSIDGDKSKVQKNPILNACDAQIHIEFALEAIAKIERLVQEGVE